ncbi:Maltose permease [Lachnellula hyalina]|uniref:Maltose permease n=1 Tax=Lachnellula hyalina TaxID=1316788 RepID=A0A8H8TWJ2_9HELO|nr:Maltose permease [Lachnellula hyalina]TVY23350.1 Maltose permease [Lachnellula hyalina]
MESIEKGVDLEGVRETPCMNSIGRMQEIGEESRRATELEHRMSFKQGLKLYPKALGWSSFFSLGIIMASFDPQLLGSLYATPAFQKDFGILFNGGYIITASWQTALGMGNPLGQIVGALLAGYPMEWYGRKKTFGVSVIGTSAFIFNQFFARSLPVLLVGELIGGLILGMYVTIAPTYASEVVPIALRGHLTAFINLCFVIGQLLANGVIAETSQINNHWAYSAPFALQWLWPAIILLGLPFAPESPWWLVRKQRYEDAERSLNRLSSSSVNNKLTLAIMIETDRLEYEMETGTTYCDCFKKVNLRRTEISIGVFVIQALSGIYLINYATLFFQLAGLNTRQSFDMSVGLLAVGFVGTCIAWCLLSLWGRRRIYNIGLALMTVVMFAIGFLDLAPDYLNKKGDIWAECILMMIWNLLFNISVGPICYTFISEVSATKLRTKTIAIATATQALFAIGMTVGIPYMINPDQGNWRGKMGFFFGGLSVISLIWCWYRIPETGGRTYEELNLMFERKVKTRAFKNYKVV